MSCTRFSVRSVLAVALLAAPSWAQSFDALVARGDAAVRAARHDEAIAAYSAALALQPEAPRVLTARGKAHAARGELRLAQRDFERAHEIDARFVPASDELIALGERMAPAAEAIRMAQARESLAENQLWRGTFEEPGRESSSSQIAVQAS